MPESLSVENQILLSCARREFDPAAQDAVKDLLQQDVDWDTLLAVARRHSLLPLLYARLREVDGGQVPPAVMAHLKSAYYTNLLRNQRLSSELAEVVATLRAEGIEAIVLKGGALAHTVYAHPAHRPMHDLDLLIRPEHVDRAGTTLESIGFRLSGSVPARLVPFQKRFSGGLEWLRSAGGHTTRLDLHHHPIGVDWCRPAFAIEDMALWQAAHPFAIDGTRAWQLSAEDSLLHLCLHPPLHHGYAGPLLAYVDIDRIIAAAGPTLSWSSLVERAARFRVRNALYLGLYSAHSLVGTPVPPEVLYALRPSHLRLTILRMLVFFEPGAMLAATTDQPSGVRQVLLFAALADHAWAVGRMGWRLLFPSQEWLTVRYSLVSERQARRYRLVHPWRLARASLRALRHPLVESSLD